jgi:hypothetical protein
MNKNGDAFKAREIGHGNRPGRKVKRKPTVKQEIYAKNVVAGVPKCEAAKIAGYGPTVSPDRFIGVKEAMADWQRKMTREFMSDAQEMRQNMLQLARESSSDAVRFQATKDILDRAGLNPINKSQTESAKYVSVESRFSRNAIERYQNELKEGQKEKGSN